MKVEDELVFVSDGDTPFGEAVARRFAGAGAQVVVNTTTEAGAAAIASLPNVQAVRADLSSRASLAALLDRVASDSGPPGIYVHTANTILKRDIESCTPEEFDRTVREELSSAFVCTQVIGRQMAERGRGAIIYLGSIHGEKPTRSCFSYSVTKGALTMLCREAALELGRCGINVNLIAMGPIEGDDERFGDERFPLYAAYRSKIPAGGPGSPEDAARLACFLASDEARYLNGAEIALDGGFLLHYLDNKTRPAEEERR